MGTAEKEQCKKVKALSVLNIPEDFTEGSYFSIFPVGPALCSFLNMDLLKFRFWIDRLHSHNAIQCKCKKQEGMFMSYYVWVTRKYC